MLMSKESVIYEGEEYRLEWYFDSKGQSQAADYFDALSDSQKRKALRLFKLIADLGKIHDKTKFRYEDDAVYAFKPQPERFLCFFFKGKKQRL
jgi:hypothetical protein